MTSLRSAPNELLIVIVYGTIWPRVTFSIEVVLVTATAPPSLGSSGMWLLNNWLEPGTWLPSSVRNR